MAESGKTTDVGLLSLLFWVLLLVGTALVALGVYLALAEAQYTILALGVVALAIPASVFAVLETLRQQQARFAEQLTHQVELLRSLNERVLISDQAKHLAFRHKDRDTLRDAIIEDIRIEDYEAAMALVKEMADTYGYREEAETFRQQILAAQAKRREALVQRARAMIDEVCAAHDWERARHEVARLMRLYPEDPEISSLPERVRQAREAYKHDLLREFQELYERDDMDAAMDRLRVLDKYLTPDEAAPYREMARQVISKKRENLGVRFKMALQDRDWPTAVNVGELIIKEFPNSTYAQEVHEHMDMLRERAAAQRAG